ncbi:MAG: hypothetical protein RBR30_01235 [Tenuifilaceae bacterium]|nr:hypothetical protein [Tenuifilaceae bacterium]
MDINMVRGTDNIELRSEKARSIIGQIPPIIVRVGIAIMSIIIIIFLLASYLIKFDYTIKTTAYLEQNSDSIAVIIKIPANEINKIKLGQSVILSFDNIPYLYNKKIVTEIISAPNVIDISSSGGYYFSKILLPNEILKENGSEFKISGKIELNAEIFAGKTSFLERITEPFKSLNKN